MEGGDEGQPRQQQQAQDVNILTQIQEMRQEITEQPSEVVRLLQPQQPQPLQRPPAPPQGQGPPPQQHGNEIIFFFLRLFTHIIGPEIRSVMLVTEFREPYSWAEYEI